ncbi:MAG: hypothetical protein RQ801_10670, partial [Spirochaetaceae bacterium]|nr:hypothetical protein [Spirochaetaceae bacterium]
AGSADITSTLDGVTFTYPFIVTAPLPTTALVDDFSSDSSTSWTTGGGVGWGDATFSYSGTGGNPGGKATVGWDTGSSSGSGVWIDFGPVNWDGHTGIKLDYNAASATDPFHIVVKDGSDKELAKSPAVTPTTGGWNTKQFAFVDSIQGSGVLSSVARVQIFIPKGTMTSSIEFDNITAY